MPTLIAHQLRVRTGGIMLDIKFVRENPDALDAVSYTHLTLPTN